MIVARFQKETQHTKTKDVNKTDHNTNTKNGHRKDSNPNTKDGKKKGPKPKHLRWTRNPNTKDGHRRDPNNDDDDHNVAHRLGDEKFLDVLSINPFRIPGVRVFILRGRVNENIANVWSAITYIDFFDVQALRILIFIVLGIEEIYI